MKDLIKYAIWNTLKGQVKGLFILLGSIGLIILLRYLTSWPSFWITVLVFGTGTVIRGIGNGTKTKRIILNLIIMMISIKVVWWLFAYSVGFGFTGLVIMCIAMACWIMFGSKAKRQRYVEKLKDIERLIYGKSLDEYEPGTRPKLKFVWKDDDNETMQKP